MSLPPGGFGPPPAYGPQASPYGPPANPYGAPPPHTPPAPDFLAADKTCAVVIDPAGVSFEANGQTLDFGWRDVANVQFRPSPVGHRLMVAVVIPDGRFFECVVNARKAPVLQQWLAEIAYVTSVYLAGRNTPA
jgi:hypothetical protein